ncbi:unnamed protein product [Brassica rapa subsp. trilocularis]
MQRGFILTSCHGEYFNHLFVCGFEKVESLTIGELNEFVVTAQPQVELIAAYESDEAVFGGFNGKMTKLTNIRATEVGHLLVLKTLKTVSSLCTLLTLWARVTCSSLCCPTSTLLPHIRHQTLLSLPFKPWKFEETSRFPLTCS